MRSTALAAAILTTAGVLSAACGSSTRDVGVGNCFRTGTAAAFGWGSEVPCDRPHSVEVFAVRDVSGLFADTPRRALEEEGNPARQRYLSLTTEFCEPVWSDYSGFGDLGNALAPHAVVLPAIYGDMALEASPAADWDAGRKTVICYQVLGRPGVDGEQAISVDRPVLTMLGRAPAAVPLQVRDCAMSPLAGQSEKRVSCQEPHDREYLGHLNLAQFVGRIPGLDQAFLDRFNSASAPAKDWAVLDGLCGRIFHSLPGHSRADISLLAQVHTGDPTWGWADKGAYHAACFARTGQQATRSVVGIGDRPLAAPG
ncbi:MAG: septum formation family protein [Pseudonocardiaceae bacterium]